MTLSYVAGMPPPSSVSGTGSPGRTAFLRSMSHNNGVSAASAASNKPPPPPPVRRSSSISAQDVQEAILTRTSSFRSNNANDTEDATPHGSVENVNIISPTNGEDRLSLEAMVAKASDVASNLMRMDNAAGGMKRSNSEQQQSSPQKSAIPPPMSTSGGFIDRDSLLRRSLTLTSRTDRASLISSLTERISQRMQANKASFNPASAATSNSGPPSLQNNHQNSVADRYNKVGTRHVITVNGPAKSGSSGINGNANVNGNSNGNNKKAGSPEGEIYGFGNKFKETTKHYFDMSASYPNTESVENQRFLDALSTKLIGKPVNAVTPTVPPAAPAPPPPSSNLTANGNPIKDPAMAKSKLNAEITSGSFNLRKTNGIANDRSAPKF